MISSVSAGLAIGALSALAWLICDALTSPSPAREQSAVAALLLAPFLIVGALVGAVAGYLF
jgi:F0F1-type ATP synthase assembly protein I